VQKYKFNKDGLPLIAYCPDIIDQLPVPDSPDDGLWHGGYNIKAVSSWDPTGLNGCSGATSERLLAYVTMAVGIMEDWKKAAREKGHEEAELVYDGSSFYACYYKIADLTTHVAIKRQAEREIEFFEERIKQQRETLENAREILGIPKEEEDEE
jgi:hypothetical protein